MNALPQTFADAGDLRFSRMHADSVDEVMAIDADVFPFSWTHKVFMDTIQQGYECWVLRDANHRLVGYYVLMPVVDEAHLLTIAVRRDWQGRGIGRMLMDNVFAVARGIGAASILLEVRPSNERALDMYRRYGFAEIGRRRHYYQSSLTTREDAIVMRLPL